MSFFSHKLYLIEKAYYRVAKKFQPTRKPQHKSERKYAILPPEGRTISVELALNSRCSSDYDGNPREFHWGMLDTAQTLEDAKLKEIIEMAAVPRFTEGKLTVRLEDNYLEFLIENQDSQSKMNQLMVESGMQQQAVGLISSALGVGFTLNAQGRDGKKISEKEHLVIKIRLDAMEPSYEGSYWSKRAPNGRFGWISGNLPDPVRDGNTPLLSTLPNLDKKHEGLEKLTSGLFGQVLWAARGRTPHLYKTQPWGLTIPTWGGRQEITSIYVIEDGNLLAYSNWDNHRPTHSLIKIQKIDENMLVPLRKEFLDCNKFVIIARNENFNRAYWEVGYQLLNMMVQSKVLDISYKATIIDERQRSLLDKTGIGDPVAVIGFIGGIS